MIRCPAGIAILLAAGPLQAQPRHEFTELHMGVAVRVVLHAGDPDAARQAVRAAFDRIATLEDVFSDYRAGSEIRRLAQAGPGWVPVSRELATVLAAARDLAERSDGAFDPTAGALTALWRESRLTGRLPDPEELEQARLRSGWRAFRVDTLTSRVHLAHPGLALDLGGIAKGYIIGEALDLLVQRGITRALIQAGGDLVVGDAPPGRPGWEIAISGEPPEPRVHLAVATSGTGEQFVEIDGVRYAHLLDPRTGLGLTRDIEVTVIGPDPMLADALATTVAVLGPTHATRLRAAYPAYRAIVSPHP